MTQLDFNQIINEWSYRLPKGYPTMKDGLFVNHEEIEVLREVLKEHGVNELPNFVKIQERELPVSDNTISEERLNKDAIIDLIKKMDTDALSDDAIQKLYNRIKAFTVFKPMRSALKAKGFAVDEKTGKFDIPKQISNRLQGFLEDLPPNSYNTFINYIQDPKQQVAFPAKVGWGDMSLDIPDQIDRGVLKAIAYYTGQDERKRGVGMGEILMALVFDNITKPGKGDLYLNGGEFEVKGAGAILGALGSVSPGDVDAILEPVGITNANKKPIYKDTQYNKAKLASALQASAADGNGDSVKEVTKQLMVASGVNSTHANTAADLVSDWNNASSGDVNRVFGLGNFLQYAEKENFTRFIAIDYGSGAKGDGQYAYVQGSPEEMAKQLMDLKVGFQGASVSSLWPRIDATGGPADVLKESEEELD